MTIKNNISNDEEDVQHTTGNEFAISKKLDELVELLSKSEITGETARKFKNRFDHAIHGSSNKAEIIDTFKDLDVEHSSREELIDSFSILLSNNQFDSKVSHRFLRGERFSKIVLATVSVVMIVLGFGMIIMPAPPFFEMFTIYYFNQNDGITIMDLISLLIILAGIYFLIKVIYLTPARKR